MTDVIIDTNVLVVANGQNGDVVLDCRQACIEFLIQVVERDVILIDDDDKIRAEYTKSVNVARPYQVGTQFLIHLLRNIGNPARVRQVQLPLNTEGEYVNFPSDSALCNFDRSDRKFVALSSQTRVPVTNATDSDWANFRAQLSRHGVAVVFLCGGDPDEWFCSK